jgi:hypothetical protein
MTSRQFTGHRNDSDRKDGTLVRGEVLEVAASRAFFLFFMKRAFAIGFLLFGMMSGRAQSTNATVTGNLLDMFGVSTSPLVTFTPAGSSTVGFSTVLAAPRTIKPSGGAFTLTNVESMVYRVTAAGVNKGLDVYVPPGTNTYSISTLITNATVFRDRGYLSQAILPGTNVTFVTNHALAWNETLTISSTGGSGGAATNATLLNSVPGTATLVPVNVAGNSNGISGVGVSGGNINITNVYDSTTYSGGHEFSTVKLADTGTIQLQDSVSGNADTISMNTSGHVAVTGYFDAGQIIKAKQFNATGAGVVSGYVGNGPGLTNLNASQLLSGTVADARLSSNIPLKNGENVFTGNTNTFNTLNVSGNVIMPPYNFSPMQGVVYWPDQNVWAYGSTGRLHIFPAADVSKIYRVLQLYMGSANQFTIDGDGSFLSVSGGPVQFSTNSATLGTNTSGWFVGDGGGLFNIPPSAIVGGVGGGGNVYTASNNVFTGQNTFNGDVSIGDTHSISLTNSTAGNSDTISMNDNGHIAFAYLDLGQIGKAKQFTATATGAVSGFTGNGVGLTNIPSGSLTGNIALSRLTNAGITTLFNGFSNGPVQVVVTNIYTNAFADFKLLTNGGGLFTLQVFQNTNSGTGVGSQTPILQDVNYQAHSPTNVYSVGFTNAALLSGYAVPGNVYNGVLVTNPTAETETFMAIQGDFNYAKHLLFQPFADALANQSVQFYAPPSTYDLAINVTGSGNAWLCEHGTGNHTFYSKVTIAGERAVGSVICSQAQGGPDFFAADNPTSFYVIDSATLFTDFHLFPSANQSLLEVLNSSGSAQNIDNDDGDIISGGVDIGTVFSLANGKTVRLLSDGASYYVLSIY